MALSHDLSGEIAAALFSGKERSPQELSELKDMIFEIHSTLEQMTQQERMARWARLEATQTPNPDEPRDTLTHAASSGST